MSEQVHGACWDGLDVAIAALWDRGRKRECREPWIEQMIDARFSLLPMARALTHTAYALSTGHGRRSLR